MNGLFGLVVWSLLFQAPQGGPRLLRVDENAPVKPPLVVPAGTAIPIALINQLSTKSARDGDGVYGQTIFPITINNEIVIPVGSYVRGKIVEVRQPGRVKGKAALTLSFQTLVLPNGATLPIYASLGGTSEGKREGESSVQGDASKSKDAGTITEAAVDGAIIGAVVDRGKGAAIGGGAGAAAGLAAVLLTRGSDLVLPKGTTIEIVLDRPFEP